MGKKEGRKTMNERERKRGRLLKQRLYVNVAARGAMSNELQRSERGVHCAIVVAGGKATIQSSTDIEVRGYSDRG